LPLLDSRPYIKSEFQQNQNVLVAYEEERKVGKKKTWGEGGSKKPRLSWQVKRRRADGKKRTAFKTSPGRENTSRKGGQGRALRSKNLHFFLCKGAKPGGVLGRSRIERTPSCERGAKSPQREWTGLRDAVAFEQERGAPTTVKKGGSE